MASMKDALLSAFAAAGQVLPQSLPDRKASDHKSITSGSAAKKGSIAQSVDEVRSGTASKNEKRHVVARAPNGDARLVPVEYGQTRPYVPGHRSKGLESKANNRPGKGVATVVMRDRDPAEDKALVPRKAQAAPMSQQAEPETLRPEAAQPEISVAPDARCLVTYYPDVPRAAADHGEAMGVQTQLAASTATDVHDVTIGLDFGTSTVKVVVTDASLERSFAVPLCMVDGFDAYLLPSRVFECVLEPGKALDGVGYSLSHGDRAHRDLKLGLLAHPGSPEHRERVVAFFALVLRNVRAWLFKQYAGVYRQAHIAWRVAIGLPSVSALDNAMAPVLQHLVCAAWHVAGLPGTITSGGVQGALRESLTAEALDLEVVVLPEIAAQIYGFVVSQRFDRKAANRFVMVDVGAGTVDSALFRVLPPKRGVWSFEFFTAVVQPFGVANLHARRVSWWERVLGGNTKAEGLLEQLSATKFDTDMEMAPPATYLDYFKGVAVRNAPKPPDEDFFQHQVMGQVSGQTMWRAWKESLLSKEDLTGIPIFVCGGGSRMPFYARINDEIGRTPGCPWLRAEPWLLDFPQDLVCENPDPAHFDRLSVAYGLSRLNIGSVTQVSPMLELDTPRQSWGDRYVGKDAC